MGVLFGRLEISKLSLPKLSFPTLIFASSIGVPFSAFVTLKLSGTYAIFPGTPKVSITVRVPLLISAPGWLTRIVYSAYGAVSRLYAIPFFRKLLSKPVVADTL